MGIVAVDVGGTKIAAATVAPEGALGPIRRLPTRAAEGPQAVLEQIAAAVSSVDPRPDAIGIGTAGVVDASAGRIISATDAMPGWPGVDVVAEVRARTEAPLITVVNDVDAHALGEAVLGAGRGHDMVLCVAVGTGIGAGLVIGGGIHFGGHHVAGEIGHMPAAGAEGLRCPCGRPGHLEAVGAGPAIARQYTARSGQPVADAREVFRRATEGDGVAADCIERSAVAVGSSLAGAMTLLDPDIIVVGGGLPEAGEQWWSPMSAAFGSELIDVLAGASLVPAELGSNAALHGAGILARELIQGQTSGGSLGAPPVGDIIEMPSDGGQA